MFQNPQEGRRPPFFFFLPRSDPPGCPDSFPDLSPVFCRRETMSVAATPISSAVVYAPSVTLTACDVRAGLSTRRRSRDDFSVSDLCPVLWWAGTGWSWVLLLGKDLAVAYPTGVGGCWTLDPGRQLQNNLNKKKDSFMNDCLAPKV